MNYVVENEKRKHGVGRQSECFYVQLTKKGRSRCFDKVDGG